MSVHLLHDPHKPNRAPTKNKKRKLLKDETNGGTRKRRKIEPCSDLRTNLDGTKRKSENMVEGSRNPLFLEEYVAMCIEVSIFKMIIQPLEANKY